ncbi:MAG: cyanophycinase [Bacteroidales bacterium]|nr:cyanophycinase [Bacteroidales bacterium]
MKKAGILVILSFVIIWSKAASQEYQGSLVIAGGDLHDDNASVFHQLIHLAGGADKATFAVVPSASGVPVQSYTSFRNVLVSYGADPEKIHLIPVAMVDDDSTASVNEAEWKDNGNDTTLAGIIRACSGVWFTGGDQSRTAKTLLRPDGSKTVVLEAIWEVFRSGGVIGGSSAGAAIMSKSMIGGGNSMAALTRGVVTDYQGNDFPDGGGLLMLHGLGFFPSGIVDQHFDARARFGRLAVALMDSTYGCQAGFGVDENTALIYLGSQNLVKVAGASGVTVMNRSDARISYVRDLPRIENLSVSYLMENDTYDLSTGKITPAEGKRPTRGNEYYNIPNPGQTGILSGNSATLSDLLTINLMDNKGADMVRNVTFAGDQTGFLVTLIKMSESKGFYIEQPYGTEKYTIVDVRMDITPVEITVKPLKNKSKSNR